MSDPPSIWQTVLTYVQREERYALQAKSERTADIIAEIEESDNENSLLGDDTSQGEYDDVRDSDIT